MSGDLGENAIGLTSKGDDIEAIRVAITGGARNIGTPYCGGLRVGLFRKATYSLATGDTPGMQRLEGVRMELRDSISFGYGSIALMMPMLHSKALIIFLVGSRPELDMDRSDLVLRQWSDIRRPRKAIDEVASKNVKVITVGNPCKYKCTYRNANSQHSLEAIYRNDEARSESSRRPDGRTFRRTSIQNT